MMKHLEYQILKLSPKSNEVLEPEIPVVTELSMIPGTVEVSVPTDFFCCRIPLFSSLRKFNKLIQWLIVCLSLFYINPYGLFCVKKGYF